MSQEGECLEVEDTRKYTDEEFVLDMRNAYFSESEEIEK